MVARCLYFTLNSRIIRVRHIAETHIKHLFNGAYGVIALMHTVTSIRNDSCKILTYDNFEIQGVPRGRHRLYKVRNIEHGPVSLIADG